MNLIRFLDPVFWCFVVCERLLEMEQYEPWWLPCCPSHWLVAFLTWLDIGHNWRK